MRLRRLLKHYPAVNATIPPVLQGGYYDDRGKWVPPREGSPTLLRCSFLPMDSKRILDGSGNYSTKDRKIFTRTKLEEGQKVTYQEATYTIESEIDYSLYSGFFVYIAKWVSK